MIKKEFWKYFKEGNIAVHVKTFKQAKAFTQGVVDNINPDERPIEGYEFYKHSKIAFHCEDKSWKYCSLHYYIEGGFTIVEYDDILESENDDILESENLQDSFKIVAMVGCSASGKDSIQAKLIEVGFEPVISHTSRPMRQGEVDGREYHFIDKERASEMLSENEFIEHRIYHVANGEDWIYGISKQAIENAYINGNTSVVIVDFQGLKELKKYLESEGLLDRLTSIYVNASPQTRLIRSLSREGEMTSEQVEEVIRRYNDDKQNVEPAILYCDIAIKNETEEQMDRAIKIIKAIIGD